MKKLYWTLPVNILFSTNRKLVCILSHGDAKNGDFNPALLQQRCFISPPRENVVPVPPKDECDFPDNYQWERLQGGAT